MENQEMKLLINCGVCDARTAAEEALSGYGEVSVNSGVVIVSRESKALLTRLGVKLNCGVVTECPADVKISHVNGKAEIKPTDTVAEKTYLMVNGKLTIAPGSQDVLGQYVGIQINGKVLCPESLGGMLGKMQINGKTVLYPDEAIVLKNDTPIDRTFALRAKERMYWADGTLIMVDPRLDPAALAKKGATFSAGRVIIAEGLVEGLIDRIDERAEIVIVPDGTAVVSDDVELNALAVKRYGTRLYIDGDVEADGKSREALEALEYLNIQGDVLVTADVRDLLLTKADVIAGEVDLRKGRVFNHLVDLKITRAMLDGEPGGICANGCVNVTLDRDIPNELILERLELKHCVDVNCTPEQESALRMVSEDVIDFGDDGEPEEADPNTRVIDVGMYVL